MLPSGFEGQDIDNIKLKKKKEKCQYMHKSTAAAYDVLVLADGSLAMAILPHGSSCFMHLKLLEKQTFLKPRLKTDYLSSMLWTHHYFPDC